MWYLISHESGSWVWVIKLVWPLVFVKKVMGQYGVNPSLIVAKEQSGQENRVWDFIFVGVSSQKYGTFVLVSADIADLGRGWAEISSHPECGSSRSFRSLAVMLSAQSLCHREAVLFLQQADPSRAFLLRIINTKFNFGLC